MNAIFYKSVFTSELLVLEKVTNINVTTIIKRQNNQGHDVECG